MYDPDIMEPGGCPEQSASTVSVMDARTDKENVSDLTLHIGLLYLINIHCLSVDFDWSRAGHGEGAILSYRMIILPSDVISSQKLAPALVVTCVCLQCTWRVLFCHVA